MFGSYPHPTSMFNGTGATCVAARATGSNWIGIDLNPDYCREAEQVVKSANNSRQMSLFEEDILENVKETQGKC